MTNYNLFVDLDGVLVDFDAGVRALFNGLGPDDIEARFMWPRLAKAKGFYDRLPWMSDGKTLWDFVRPYSPTILTGLPRGNWAEPEKRAWCSRELGPDVPVLTCLSRDKARLAADWCADGAVPVLVDDRISLQESWEGIGGIFIFHQNALSSIEALERLGFNSPSKPYPN